MDNNHEIDFIAGHYREGRFSATKAWIKLGFKRSSWWTAGRVAASIFLAIGLTATATIAIHRGLADKEPVQKETVSRSLQITGPLDAVRIIDFEDTALPQVIDKVKEVYGVDITNIPENASEYKLSLHYEGNVRDLIATINELLDLNLAVKEE